MKRRDLLQNAAFAGLTGFAASTLSRNANADDKTGAREFYELRTYTLKDDAQRKIVDEYLEKAFIPAMNRLGSANIGVFAEAKPNAPLNVLIPYSSLEQFAKATAGLLSDSAHNTAGAAYLNIEGPGRAYERLESSLLQAFEGWPKLVTPPQKKDKKAHIFQLRTYEGLGEVTGKKKIEMFHKGEMGAFKDAGANPVFFAETIIGAKRPNLTYMLAFDDKAALDASWKTFVANPDFRKLMGMPEYSNARVIRNIGNQVLTPTEYSQL